MREPVKLFMRVENHSEVCIGTANTIADVPKLLERVATMLRAGLAPDELEKVNRLIGSPGSR